LIEHWDGKRWTIVPSPTPPVSSWLVGIAASATDDVWAVGYNIPDSVRLEPPIEHWDGSQWTIVPSPNPSGYSRLTAVATLAPDDAWAVGERGPGAVFMHWDGDAWTLVPGPDDAGNRFAITALSTNDIWAAGESRFGDTHMFTHWDGTSWTTVPNLPLGLVDATVDMFGISAVASDDIWSVGDARVSQCDDTCMNFEFAELQHWDGSGWQRVAGPSTSSGYSGLRNVSAQSAQRIWVVGHSGPDTLVSLWDGTRWIQIPSLSGGSFASLAPTPEGDVWAVGAFSAGSQRRTLTTRYFCR
jgi:hypothetical protein